MSKKNPAELLKFVVGLFIALLAFAVILLLAIPIGFYAMAMYLAPTLPSVSEIKTATLEMPLQIYSRDDKLIGQYGNRMSLPVTFEQIPPDLINAFLAAEDASFFQHSGISIKGLGRALTEVVTDDNQTGGSTITMQVAKNYFLTPDRTINRKLTELFLARKIEDELSKNDILTLYVNKIYLGEGAYGIRAAAKKYYSKSLDQLTIAEMAMLSGLPKAPSRYNPVANPERAMIRRNWILGRMLEEGYISQAQHDEAVAEPIGLNLYQEQLDVNMPYLAEMTRYALVSQYGKQVINSGWRVRLTVDSTSQQVAEKAINDGLVDYDRRHGWRGAEANDEPLENFRRYGQMYPAKVTKVNSRSFEATLASGESVTVPWSGMSWARKYFNANRIGNYPGSASQIVNVDDIVRLIPNSNQTQWSLTQIPDVQGSLVSLDPETGALKALIGGFNYNYSKFNRATDGWRQPGSTIKPLVYTAALEKGYQPDSMVSDQPIQVGDWKPKNSDGRFYGDMTLRRGLYLSRNMVSIRLLRSTGIEDTRNLLDQFGLDEEKLPTTLSLALGAGQASPLQMATAYATFGNGGHRIQPYFIEQIFNYNNQLLFQANPAQACAVCFNNSLDDINEKLRTDYDEKTQAQNDNQTNETEAAVESTQNDNSNEANSDNQNTNNTANTANSDSAYNAGPTSDRLKAPVTQYVTANQAPRILSANVAYEMAGILKDVIQRGTATKAKALGRSDIGGKTGTTNDAKDAWFAGFHPTTATVVWMGFDNPSTLGRREYGGVAALPVWMDFMREELKNTPYQWVEVSNRSKSKKQQQRVINLTNNGEKIQATEEEVTNPEDDTATEVTEPSTQAREAPPAAEPEQENNDGANDANTTNNSASNASPPSRPQTSSDSRPNNPLSVTEVEQMPPMPTE